MPLKQTAYYWVHPFHVKWKSIEYFAKFYSHILKYDVKFFLLLSNGGNVI